MKNKLKWKKKNPSSKIRRYALITFIILLFMYVGFAAISASLQIQGNITALQPDFNTFINSVTSESGSVTPVEEATIVGNKRKEIQFATSLSTLQSYYGVNVEIKNQGKNDAYYLGSEIKIYDNNDNEISMPEELEVVLFDENNNNLLVNYSIPTGSTKATKLRFKYKDGATLPADKPVYKIHVIYNFGPDRLNVTAAQLSFSNSQTTMTNAQDAIDELNSLLS